MKIEYSKPAAKFLSALDRPTKLRLREAIDGLTEDPPKGDIKHPYRATTLKPTGCARANTV